MLGYRTDRLAGFYLTDSGQPVPWRVESPAEVAAIMRARADVGAPGGVLVANPLPVDEQLDPALHDRVLDEALAAAADAGRARQGDHAVPAGPPQPRDGRRQPAREHRARDAQRGACRRDRRGGSDGVTVVVIGDVKVDVVAAHDAPLARGSDTPARTRLRGGGGGGNVAAWLAHAGRRRCAGRARR